MIVNDSALLVLSGGQDSTTLALWAKAKYSKVHAVTFDYGQRHRAEIEAAKQVADRVGVDSHKVINVQGLLLGRSPLIDPNAALETYTDHATMAEIIGDRIETTFVPLRNLFFLTVAANYALSLDTYTLITGVCEEDNANYPDCTENFIVSTEFALQEALGMHRLDYAKKKLPLLTIEAPLLHRSKADTVRLAMEFDGWEQALEVSHTCYAGKVPPCGECHACVLRAEGFKNAGVKDPLVTRFEDGREEGSK